MKYLSLLFMCLILASCKKEEQPPKDYAVIHGKISNPTEGLGFRLYNPATSKSVTIPVDKNGVFRDTLKLEEPASFNGVYENVFGIYLENDMDLELTFDKENITKTIAFSGKGAEENNFLREKNKRSGVLMGEDYKEYLALDDAAFDRKTDDYNNGLIEILDAKKEVMSPEFITLQKENLQNFKTDITAQHKEQLEINSKLSKGMPSPPFTDYVNYSGGTNDLEDYRGKYVYIDIWATWCVPCIVEMPYMNEIEKEYADKNIQFIGLSIDDPAKDEQKWRDMIVDKELHGTQLLADNQIDSKFVRDYYIYGIPRFILLDPQGNIITYDAPRPSEPRLKELFDSLDI
ncbi:TlpA family protein disulfide reductase [Nonlabens antarcticus]|uniref:TlpA family protein disulfide reductase n=1 Tax=Nonlabens antarcticus TaxID=392714 RepID=UPI001891129F|nr:TlpA disulfide reductase family protein [Nonlabens antarcticus]